MHAHLKLSMTLLAGFLISVSIPQPTAQAEDSSASPFKKKAKAPPPKPQTRSWTAKVKGEQVFTYLFDFEPGIADTDKVVEIFITINEIPEKADIKFGKRIPQQNAEIVLELIDASEKTVGRYLAHAVPFSRGKYGVHLTAKSDGIHSLRLTGATEKGVVLNVEVKLPVNVWPLPDELKGTGDAPSSARRRPIKL